MRKMMCRGATTSLEVGPLFFSFFLTSHRSLLSGFLFFFFGLENEGKKNRWTTFLRRWEGSQSFASFFFYRVSSRLFYRVILFLSRWLPRLIRRRKKNAIHYRVFPFFLFRFCSLDDHRVASNSTWSFSQSWTCYYQRGFSDVYWVLLGFTVFDKILLPGERLLPSFTEFFFSP